MTGIAEFWKWWSTARDRIERALANPPEAGREASLASGELDGLAEEIGERVSAIDPSLDWELGPGVHGARHAFCLSAKGDPDGRRLTERWMRAGPPPDARWEFHPARLGALENLSLRLEIAEHRIGFEELSVSFKVDGSREHIDLVMFHPEFAQMEEALRARVAFLALDNTLGEDGVERWLGAIETTPDRPNDAQPFRALLDAVTELARTATGERFSVLRGEVNGAAIFLTVNRALKRIDHLLCDVHIGVRIALHAPDAHGLPTNEEAETLNALEDELTAAMPDAVYAGRETSRGVRMLHYYAPELGRELGELEAWKKRHREYDIDFELRRDPRWEAIRRWS